MDLFVPFSTGRRRGGMAAASAILLLASACAGNQAAPAPSPEIARADSLARAELAREKSRQAALPPGVRLNTIAVTPFAAPANDSILEPLAYGLAELLTTDLARSDQLAVVERARLDAILREQKLTEAGRVDPITAPQAGKLMQARRLVIGAVNSGGDRSAVRLDVRVADVAQGSVASAVSATAPVASVLDGEKEVVFRLFDQLGVTLTPAQRAAIEARQTRNLAALLAFGRGRKAEVEGRAADARKEYENAQRLDPSFLAPAAKLVASSAEAPPSLLSSTRLSILREQGDVVIPGFNTISQNTVLNNVNKPLVQIPIAPPTTATASNPSFPRVTVDVIITIIKP